MKTHNLKIWKESFEMIASGEKCFELCKHDQGFKVGDILDLIEIDPDNDMCPTGRILQKEITFILRGGQWGLEPGYVVLSLKNI